MNDEETVKAAMSILGRSRSPRKLKTAAENLAKAHAACREPAARAKLRAAQQARREREKAAREAEKKFEKSPNPD